MGNSSSSVEYEYFWQSNEDPFKEGITPIWTPYEKSASSEIEKAYQIFLQNSNQNVFLLNNQFKLDFKNWLQLNLKNPKEIQRPFKRDIPDNVLNIVRRNRFNEALVFKNQPKINLINCKAFDFLKNENYIIVKKFDIFENENLNLTMMVPCRFDFFKEKLPKFSLYLKVLKDEILSMGPSKDNPYKDKLEKIKEDNFYETMVFIYTIEDYLYKILNSILREGHANNFPKIAYFYTALSASIRYFKKESIQMLENEGKLLDEQKKVLTKGKFKLQKRRFVNLYRCSSISQNEIDEYKKLGNQPIIRQLNDFYSTSIDSEVVKNFIKSGGTSDCHYFLKAKIPVYDGEIDDGDFFGKQENFVDFAYISKYSNYKSEGEVLIKSGTSFQVTKFQESKKNFFQIEVEVLSKLDIFVILQFHEIETEQNKFGIQQILKGCIIF